VGSSVCCAAASAAATYAELVRTGQRQEGVSSPDDLLLDAQQVWLEKETPRHADRLAQAQDKAAVELPHALLDGQHKLMDQLIRKTAAQMKAGTKLAVVGGIQVNTPEGTAEYFLPKRFELLDHTGTVVQDMLEELHNSALANTPGW